MFAHAECNDFDKAKWIIIGIPSEIGSLSKVKYYSEGPNAIRDASYRVFSPIFGNINTKEIFDYGDLYIEDIKDLNELYKKIYEDIKKLYRKDKKYIFLGGDHSITYPIIKALREKNDFYFLLFDAHPDIHPDPYINYQSFIFYLIKEKILDPSKILMIGISNFSFEERSIIEKYKIKYYTAFEVIDNINKVSNEVKEILKDKNVYISIDIDVFDKGCGHWIEPLGISFYHYIKIIKDLDINLIGFDLVELFPTEICENLSAKLIIETISLFKDF